ncbi:hypothetical protein D9M71_793010 [compost metagenome]
MAVLVPGREEAVGLGEGRLIDRVETGHGRGDRESEQKRERECWQCVVHGVALPVDELCRLSGTDEPGPVVDDVKAQLPCQSGSAALAWGNP